MYRTWSVYAAEKLNELPFPLTVLENFLCDNMLAAEFLWPILPVVTDSLEDELNHIATMPEDIIESEIDWLTATRITTGNLESYAKRPRSTVNTLINELNVYWDQVLGPHWKQIRNLLQTEIMLQSQILATRGFADVFPNVSPKLYLKDNLLYCDDPGPRPGHNIDLKGGSLIIQPNIFAKGSNLSIGQTILNNNVTLTYLARGAGNWHSHSTSLAPEALSNLLGYHRTRLLTHLIEPITTSGLAANLNLTAGAVSQQLSQLYSADLVQKQRVGKKVYYSLNERGFGLLELFETEV